MLVPQLTGFFLTPISPERTPVIFHEHHAPANELSRACFSSGDSRTLNDMTRITHNERKQLKGGSEICQFM